MEVFRFLSFDCGAYLPPYDTVTVWHLRDIGSGKRAFIKAQEVKTIQIPHFDGLTVERMLLHAAQSNDVMQALPADQKEIHKLPREYIGNILYTILGDKFKKWVRKKCDERTDKIMEKQDMAIEMDPEVYKAFKASTNISGRLSNHITNIHVL